MPQPRTPLRSGQELCQLIDDLNRRFNLDIPNPRYYSPSADSGVGRGDGSLRWRIYRGMQRLYFDRNVDVYKILNNFDDWARVQHRRDDRLTYLNKLIDDESYLRGLSSSFSLSCLETIKEPPPAPVLSPPSVSPSKSLKSRISDEGDEFHTAPSSPVKFVAPPSPMLVDGTGELEEDAITGGPVVYASKAPRIAEEPRPVSRFLDKLTASMNDWRYDAVPSVQNPNHSFSSTTTTDPPSFFSNPRDQLNTSFNSTVTDITVPCFETETQYEDSVADHMLSQEHMMSFGSSTVEVPEPRYSREGEIMDELLANGPFSLEQPFPGTVPLRYRYEVERIGRAWGVPLKKMLAGSSISFKTRDQFWDWVKNHNQRDGKPLPEKPQAKAWDAATGSFQTAKHSEVVVLSGEMTWCDKSELGILKLNLRPLKTERTCRFHRRFGSDRFLSVILPAPSRPPAYLKMPSRPALLRETLALWLTRKVHRCAGRTWRPFFVEEVKSKNKRASSEPRFRVDFFAIDGVDFNASFSLPGSLPPVREESERRTPMTLEALIDWHMPPEANVNQTNCKLFQRLHLGLSKTFATVTLTPQQVFYLRDVRPVMNDGCALMSRALAQRVCDSLGITGSTPSSFQGRIAGAKGLWMVDRHASHVAAGPDDIWIQISDSQLKIGPHPREWSEPIDSEKLTFEVVKWSKPLHAVALNTQLLAILEHGGPVRKYIGEITRAGIQALYRDFEDVFQSDCPLRCRALVQKLRPAAADASDTRRLDQWASNNDECIIRLTEAGFRPRSFFPLRKRLRKCLLEVLDRYFNDLHIQVPLSTYAFCIADPYGVLNEDEVHFGLSTQWTDPAGQFEDNLLDGIDVLVGRLPAHLPSDIQRRRAVWHPRLRHFKDVIVFPTKGTTPLAHMLSGGDYDGDTPWICWDQNIVQHFANTPLPSQEYSASHYGLTTHIVPMTKIPTVDEFLESAFTFNLMMSQLGRCTTEHETIAYEKSIDAPEAIKLAGLLSHLVDGRKAGVHLSEDAWQSYRKTINPSGRRVVPAYKDPSRKYNPTNIIDYLKFVVAGKERHRLLTELEKTLNDGGSVFACDKDLTRPWQDAKAALNDTKDPHLQAELDRAERETDALFGQWNHSLCSKEDDESFAELAWQAAEKARDIAAPGKREGGPRQHALIHVWQHRRDIWLELLASLTYTKHPASGFVIHAFGEELCRIKAAAAGAGLGGSRAVVHDVLGCYRVSQRAVARAVALDVVDLADGEDGFGVGVEGEGEQEFDGVEAIQDWFLGGGGSGDYDWDPNDGASVE